MGHRISSAITLIIGRWLLLYDFKGEVIFMFSKAKIVVGSVLCFALLSGGVVYAATQKSNLSNMGQSAVSTTTKFTSGIGSSKSVDQNQLSSNGIQFIPSTDTSSVKITSNQALSIAQSLFKKPYPTMFANFGYLTLNPNNSPRIPSYDAAGQIDHGLVTNYPVWVINVSGIKLEHHPARPKGGGQPDISKMKPWVGMYTFIDAKTGEILYSVAYH
jgi:hypothetical protein